MKLKPDRITVSEARNAGYCPRGIRRWCELRGLSFKEVLRDGIDPALAQEDAYVLRILKARNGNA